ncbi:hypothetical protein [Allosphingosinicella sp.]|uniref:hypothetical protein n=1 Tax=Allosphingosinicella sp. TaxID=2823234 RepID=UPI003783346D
MILETLFLAMAQPAASARATMPTCSMVTPGGERVEFFIWSGDDSSQFNFTGTPGSSWPLHTVAGVRRNLEHGVPWFVIGGNDGMALMLSGQEPGSPRRAATLVGRSPRRAMLPMAYGFCEERPAPETAAPPQNREAAEADSPIFNPDRWPGSDCGLLLSDGRRIRLRFTLLGEHDAQLQSDELWSGAPVTTALRWSSRATESRADFDSPNGPAGTQLLIVNGSLATKVIRLRRVGGNSPPGLSGYAICGLRGIHREPNRQ